MTYEVKRGFIIETRFNRLCISCEEYDSKIPKGTAEK